MKLRTRVMLIAASALVFGVTSGEALAQRGGPPRDPHMNRPAPPRRPPPRPYYHNYNGPYYQAPVYAPPPYVYAPPPSPGISLVIPFHF
jgi:hypothetical protein